MLEQLDKSILEQDSIALEKCIINLHNTEGKIEYEFYTRIEKALKETWHEMHEEIVNLIYLKDLKDDRFIEPILEISLKKEKYRSYDDELESTLRKCIHALKMIKTEKSRKAIEKLSKMENKNIQFVLEMYN